MSTHLNASEFPAIVDAEGAARLLGVEVSGVHIGVAEGLLVPLGRPKKNARRLFFRKDITSFLEDKRKCERLVRAIYRHNQRKNGTAEPAEEEAA